MRPGRKRRLPLPPLSSRCLFSFPSGYRFQETQRLPADLVWSALEMPTACYDFECHGECEGPQNCYVLRDSYGNNAGYASVVERMLSEIEEAGGSVTFGATLMAIMEEKGLGAVSEGEEAEAAISTMGEKAGLPTTLHFQEWPASVSAARVILNLPANAIERLDPSSVLFADAPPATVTALKNVSVNAMNKAYVWYDDAWWASKLGRMQGFFEAPGGGRAEGAGGTWPTGSEAVWEGEPGRGMPRPGYSEAPRAGEAEPDGANLYGPEPRDRPHGRAATSLDAPYAPLLGRYHDGPLKCAIGIDSAGDPVRFPARPSPLYPHLILRRPGAQYPFCPVSGLPSPSSPPLLFSSPSNLRRPLPHGGFLRWHRLISLPPSPTGLFWEQGAVRQLLWRARDLLRDGRSLFCQSDAVAPGASHSRDSRGRGRSQQAGAGGGA